MQEGQISFGCQARNEFWPGGFSNVTEVADEHFSFVSAYPA